MTTNSPASAAARELRARLSRDRVLRSCAPYEEARRIENGGWTAGGQAYAALAPRHADPAQLSDQGTGRKDILATRREPPGPVRPGRPPTTGTDAGPLGRGSARRSFRMRITLIGGSGGMGTFILEEFVSRGHEVRAVVSDRKLCRRRRWSSR